MDLSQNTFQKIPIIDLKDVGSKNFSIRNDLAQEVKAACMNVGFFYVKNHGIPDEVITRVFEASRAFFSLPLESKMKISIKNSSVFKGYSPLLSGNNDPNGNGDMQEGFEFGFEAVDAQFKETIEEETHAMAGKNEWPDASEVPDFRGAALEYYHAAVGLGKSLFPLFALALGLEENFFEDKTRKSAALMKLLHYPPQEGPVDDRVIGIGAHTDWECFTILWQEPGIQALQVLNSQKEWIKAPPIPGTLVINLGDQFARWTNDVFRSTVHRAINRSGIERFSIPLFFGTDYDVKLEPIPSCVSSDRPPRYEVVTAGEYVKSKLAATYGH